MPKGDTTLDALENAAARIILRREEANWSDDDERELDAWLAQSARHKAVFWRLERGWAEADRGAVSLNAAPALPQPSRLPAWTAQLSELGRRAGLALAASVLPLLFAGWLFMSDKPQPQPQYAHYATEVGQRKILTLPDGTRIDLNTDSDIRIHMAPATRTVYLDSGEVFFDVTHDRKRPFIVRANNRQVKVLGTRFVIRREGARMTTGVIDGRVQLTRLVDRKLRDTLILNKGDLAISEGSKTITLFDDPDQVANLTGWQRGMIVLDRVTLGEAAQQFNRYNHRKLLVIDAYTASIPIAGAFKTNNIDGFTRLLSDAYGLKIETAEDLIKISQK